LDFDNMTQGDKRPERFTKGQRLTAAGLNSLTEAVESIMRRMAGQQIVQPLNLQVILGEDLLAAVDTLTDPSTAQANVLRRKTNGDLEITSRSITIVNRFENISVDAGTYAKAEWIEGEWQLYAADCPAISGSMASGPGGGGGSLPPAESF
jgi:hypothetical protein